MEIPNCRLSAFLIELFCPLNHANPIFLFDSFEDIGNLQISRNISAYLPFPRLSFLETSATLWIITTRKKGFTPMLNRSVTLSETQRFLLRNVSIIVLGLFINQMLQTVGSIILARVLDDPTKFGQVNLLLQIFGMASLFLNVGFNSSLIYTFSRKPEQAVQTNFRVAFFGSSLFGIIFGLILALLAPMLANYYHLPELKGALILSSIMFMFNSMINIGVASFSGNRDFTVQAAFMVITTTFSTSGMVLGVIWPLGKLNLLENISIWMSVGAILTALFIGWKVERVHNPKWFGKIPLQEVRTMMAYGVPSWAGNIAKAFQQPFLVMMVGSSSVVAVGYLSNGFRITGFIGIITWAFMIVTFPFVAESAQDVKESKDRGRAVFGITIFFSTR